MKIPEQIIDKAVRLKVDDRINWEQVYFSKREAGKVLRKLTEKYHFVIIGKGDINNFNEQPLVVMHLNDYLAQLKK